MVDRLDDGDKILIFKIEKSKPTDHKDRGKQAAGHVKLRTSRGKTGWTRLEHISHPQKSPYSLQPDATTAYNRKKIEFRDSDSEKVRIEKGSRLYVEGYSKEYSHLKKDVTVSIKGKKIILDTEDTLLTILKKDKSTSLVRLDSGPARSETVLLPNNDIIFKAATVHMYLESGASTDSFYVSLNDLCFSEQLDMESEKKEHREIIRNFRQCKRKIESYDRQLAKNAAGPNEKEYYPPIGKMNFSDFQYMLGELVYRELRSIDGLCSCGSTYVSVWDSWHALDGHDGMKNTIYYFGNFEPVHGLKPGMSKDEVMRLLGKNYKKSANILEYSDGFDWNFQGFYYPENIRLYFEGEKFFAIVVNLKAGAPCC